MVGVLTGSTDLKSHIKKMSHRYPLTKVGFAAIPAPDGKKRKTTDFEKHWRRPAKAALEGSRGQVGTERNTGRKAVTGLNTEGIQRFKGCREKEE